MEFEVAIESFISGLQSDAIIECQTKLKYSNEGPPKYSGDILDTGELWSQDEWNESRIEESKTKLKLQGNQVKSDYWREQYENRPGFYWHNFYKRNKDHFYKDRHYLHVVYPELCQVNWSEDFFKKLADGYAHLLEVGSGVGNAVFPLLEINSNLYVHAIDVARSAIEILRTHALVEATRRIEGHVCNVMTENLPVEAESMHFVLCMFVLSALPPKAHLLVFQKLASVLKPGGKMFIRDYARYDEAQLRFKKDNKLSENFYVRQDGTCSYFFTVEEITEFAISNGLVVEECYYITRQYANRKEQQARYRVWLHAKLYKP